MVGQVKSVKTVLKQLQQSIQTITSAGWPTDEEVLAASNRFRCFSMAIKRPSLYSCLSCDRNALNAGRLYGQGTKIH